MPLADSRPNIYRLDIPSMSSLCSAVICGCHTRWSPAAALGSTAELRIRTARALSLPADRQPLGGVRKPSVCPVLSPRPSRGLCRLERLLRTTAARELPLPLPLFSQDKRLTHIGALSILNVRMINVI